MVEKDNQRTKWLHVRLTEKEHQQILAQFKKTDSRCISDFARKILLGKPMIGTYRNKSMDEFIVELVRLRTELNHIGNNFNQLVKKLHTTTHQQQMAALLATYQSERKILMERIENIHRFIQEKGQQW